MTTVYFAIPGDIDTPTGGYIYDRRIMALLPECGVEVKHLRLPDGFPFPDQAAIDTTLEQLGQVPADAILLIDGLAYGVLPPERLGKLAAPIVVLLHHPLGLETGLSEADSRRLLDLERSALTAARQIIVTSKTTAETVVELQFTSPSHITVAEPGTERAERAKGSSGGPVEILSVGAVVRRKGHDVLVEALASLKSLDWHCTIIGSLQRDDDFVAALLRQVEEAGLQKRISFTGALSQAELDEYYARADFFALPSRYEGYGMVFSEALARGLPVVAARAGAVPGTVPPEAGVLVPPDNAPALADAIASLIGDGARRRKLADAAWAHAKKLPSWQDTAQLIAKVLRTVTPERGFSAEWLHLREAIDHRWRDAALLAKLAEHVKGRESLTILDLGCGTGSNLRAMAPHLPGYQEWHLVDHDPALLEVARQEASLWMERHGLEIGLRLEQADLRTDLERIFEGSYDIVTASALFDIVSADWLERFIQLVTAQKRIFYTVLTFDGHMAWKPAHPADAVMTGSFAAHQRSDKGFGKAAGPDAGAILAQHLEAAGYHVLTASTPWRLTADDLSLIRANAEGIAEAVRETGLVPQSEITAWLKTRLYDEIETCEIGHVDILAIPKAN